MHTPLSVFRTFRAGRIPAIRIISGTFLLLALLLAPASGLRAVPSNESAPASAGAVPTEAAPGGQPSLLPPRGGAAVRHHMQSLVDPSGRLTIDDILREDSAGSFAPLNMLSLPRQTGAFWLRLPLGGLSAAELGTGQENARLDLGDQVPGTPQVWVRTGGTTAPRPVMPDENGLYPLPGLQQGGEAIVRLDGLPGLWFSPALRSPADALNAPERKVHSLALAALTVLLMLAFVRSITERGDGRIWAGIFAGAALVQAFWGVPSTPEGSIRPLDMPGILAAAIALMLLPHVGRNIMRTRTCAPAVDILLLILALPGAALALLPILPGQAWTARLLSLWPLGALFALLPALALLLRREKGSLLFSLACFAMAVGSLLGLWGMGDSVTAPLWGQAPLLGVCIAALLLAAAAPRSAYTENPAFPGGFSEGKSPAELLEIESFGPVEVPAPPMEVSLGEVEEALRDPLDRLMRECCVLDRGLRLLEEPSGEIPPLPEAALENIRRSRADAENVLNAATALAGRIARLSITTEEETPAARDSVFDLRQLVQLAFSTVQGDAAEKNLGLSWYIAPHIALRYRGDGERLSRVLAALLTDAVRATEKGNVCLRVRREERSANPGHLQFTVADTGRGAPPVHRSSLALAHAWELATEHGGDLFVDSTPHGVEISFSLNCTALDAEDRAVAAPAAATAETVSDSAEERTPDPGSPLIILASDRSLNRQMFAWQLRGDDHETWEARDCAEAVALYKKRPASLLALDGHMPEDDIIRAVAEVRLFEGEHSLPLVPVLGLALDAEQGERLRRVGCEYLLYYPLERQELRNMARVLLAGEAPAPAAKSGGNSALHADAAVCASNDSLRQDAPISAANPEALPEKTPSAAPLPPSAQHSQEHAAPEHGGAPLPARTQTARRPAQSSPARPGRTQPSSAVPFRPRVPASGQEEAGPETLSPIPSPQTQGKGQSPHASGLPLAAPRPSGPRGWLSSLFKPRPRLEPQAVSALTSPSEGLDEWVGEPVPVRHLPGETVQKTASEGMPGKGQSLSLLPGPGEQERRTDAALPLALDLPAPSAVPCDPEDADTAPLNMHPEYPAAEHSGQARFSRSAPLSLSTPEEEQYAADPQEAARERAEEIEALPLSNVEAMPFLSMTPGEETRDDSDEIVNLTEDDMELPAPLASMARRLAGEGESGVPPVPEPAANSCPEDLAGIREDVRDALTRGDALLLTQSSARLRECARSFGLHALADLAYLLEESARDSDFEAVRMIMPDLDQLVDRELIRASGKDDAESRPIKNALMF